MVISWLICFLFSRIFCLKNIGSVENNCIKVIVLSKVSNRKNRYCLLWCVLFWKIFVLVVFFFLVLRKCLGNVAWKNRVVVM